MILASVFRRVTGSVTLIGPLMVLWACRTSDAKRLDRLDPVDSTAVVTLADEGSCSKCVTMDRIATLGDTAGPGYVNPTLWVVRDSLGRYWINQRDQLKLFAPDGRYVGEVGRKGQGPMEFQLAWPIYTDADSNVHVIDPVNKRESVINNALKLIRERRLPGRGSVKSPRPLPGGDRYVANMWIPTEHEIGLPLHIFSGDSILTSFGLDPSTSAPQSDFTQLRLIATDSAGRIYSARRFDYDVDVWSSTGRRITGLKGPTLNQQQVKPGPYNLDDNPYASEIRGLFADGRGLLWVLTWRTVPDWKEHVVEQVLPDGTAGLRLREGSNADSLYDSRIDVVDVHRGVFVAHATVDGLLSGFVGPGLVFQNQFLADGTPRILIWQVGLKGP